MDDLGAHDITILDDDARLTGGCSVGVESTVCQVSPAGKVVTVLRCGAVTPDMIRRAFVEHGLQDCRVVLNNDKNFAAHQAAVQAKSWVAPAAPASPTSPASSPLSAAVTTSAGEKGTPLSVVCEGPERTSGAVVPGQMIKHYAPDVPTYIVRGCFDAVHSLPETVLLRYRDLFNTRAAVVIDFGGLLHHLKPECKLYVDLSVLGSAQEACAHLFETLRNAEKYEGVSHILLPDIRGILNKAPSSSAESALPNSSEDMDEIIRKRNNIAASATGAERVGSSGCDKDGTAGREEAGCDELRLALWERMNRAASGTFVVVNPCPPPDQD
jgi:hypothetical protein